MLKDFDSVVEAGWHDRPLNFSFDLFKLDIPANVRTLRVETPRTKLRLYGQTNSFDYLLGFKLEDQPKILAGGWNPENLEAFYESIRSVTLADGCVFVSEIYITDPAWKWYLLEENLGRVVFAAGQMFKDHQRKSEFEGQRIVT